MAQQAQLSFGEMVRTLRAEKGMTQLDLARKMGVTDKAVSKWERDLSIPDVASLPKLAEELGTSVDELLQAKTAAQEAATESDATRKKAAALVELVLKAVALAMGVGVVALTIMDEVEPRNALGLLGVGVACLALGSVSISDPRFVQNRAFCRVLPAIRCLRVGSAHFYPDKRLSEGCFVKKASEHGLGAFGLGRSTQNHGFWTMGLGRRRDSCDFWTAGKCRRLEGRGKARQSKVGQGKTERGVAPPRVMPGSPRRPFQELW